MSRFWSRLIVLCGVAFLYFESVMWKWADPMWTSGLGVWKPASVVQVVWCDLSFLLNQRLVMLFLGYLVLFFETSFIFLMWFPRLRLSLCLIGIGLHLGIAVVFPLPWFGLVMCVLYVPLLPDWFLARFFRRSLGTNEAHEAVVGSAVLAPGWQRVALVAIVSVLFAAQLIPQRTV